MEDRKPFVVVVGVDFSEQGEQALDAALEEASLHEHAELHVVHVEPDQWAQLTYGRHLMGADVTVERVQQSTLERMSRVAPRVDTQRIGRVVAHYRHGSPAEGIAQLALTVDADLVVVASHGRGGRLPADGSVAARLTRLAPCAVRVVPVTGHTVGRIVFERHRSEAPSIEHRRRWASNGVYAAEGTVYEEAPEPPTAAHHE